MPFSRSFPRTTEKSVYPRWEEVSLTEEEEKEVEVLSHEENIRLLKRCIDDAKSIMTKKGLKPFQTDLVNIAISLFEKQASHTVYWKESRAKEKFDKIRG